MKKRVRFTFAGSVLGTQAAVEGHLVCFGWLGPHTTFASVVAHSKAVPTKVG